MSRADGRQAGMVLDALWRAFRPLAIELIDVSFACRAGGEGPAGDAELTPDEQARVDAALSRFRQRRKERAGQRNASRSTQQARQSRQSARAAQKGGGA
jgi:hypothetical protein